MGGSLALPIISSAVFSATIITGELRLALVVVGRMLASTTRKFETPRTLE